MSLPLSAFCIVMFLRSSNSENALCSALLMFSNSCSFLLYVLKEENAICRSSLRAKTISSSFLSSVSKDSFEFAKNVRNQNPDLFMASFDIDSLFTNVPIDETIDISIKKGFGRKKKYNGFSREQFKKIGFAVKKSLFLFNGTYYEQVDGVAMGSPLGSTLVNIFLCYWEEIWIEK